MRGRGTKQAVRELLRLADIEIDGDRPWDLQVHNQKLYGRVLSGGSLALGESYMDGWWDCRAMDQFFCKILEARLDERVRGLKHVFWLSLRAKLVNLQSRSRAYEIGERHYDLGNDLYKLMLDKRMVYSSAYWKNAETLDEAQEAKLDLICRKMGLEPGMRILDIGCGWGGLVAFAARKYQVEAVGITVSKEQVNLARKRCAGMPVEIRYQDYRDVDELFDRVVSVGMFEHVGHKNYRTYMELVHRCLPPGGLFLLHTIGRHTSTKCQDPWIEKYIFPNSLLPSPNQITAAAEGLFMLEDWHSFGHHYDTTLMTWYRNFRERWDQIKDNYDEEFYRMWTFFLLSSAGSFRSRKNSVWQVVFSKGGVKEGYVSVR
ncbi:MAG: cyclopropane fatty acyl phospholipid synthase [Fidelibacterota bacterium]